jgi:hypothetical protein
VNNYEENLYNILRQKRAVKLGGRLACDHLTLQSYPCNNDSISEIQRRDFTGTTFRELTVTLIKILTPTPREDMMKTDYAAASGTQVHIWSRPKDTWNSDGVHSFTGGPGELRIQALPHVNKDSIPITVFLLFFMEVIKLSVAETSKYHNQYLDTLNTDSRCSQLPDVITRDEHLPGHNNTNGG